MPMNVRDFEYIAETARQGSITKAAKMLYISQPALSKFLKRAEAEAGTPLFQAIGHRLVPTDAGQECIDAANQILLRHERMKTKLADIARLDTGQLNIGTPLSRGRFLIATVLPGFYRRHPNICVRIVMDSMRELTKKLRAGEIDLVYAPVSEEFPDLEYRYLETEEMVLAAPAKWVFSPKPFRKKGYAFLCLHTDAWKDKPFLMLEQDQASYPFVCNWLATAGVTPQTVFVTRNLSQILYAVRTGIGITICPAVPPEDREAERKIRYYSLYADAGPALRKTAVVYRKNSYISRAGEEFTAILGRMAKIFRHGK